MTEKPKLAKKQRRVLDLLEKGKTPSQVAKTLKISVNGVYGHMRRIEAKGYQVPRKGDKPTSAARRVHTARTKASTNGSGPVGQIDAEIGKLTETIRKRQQEIGKETLEIKGQTKALEDRTNALLAETDALAQRQKALAAASA